MPKIMVLAAAFSYGDWITVADIVEYIREHNNGRSSSRKAVIYNNIRDLEREGLVMSKKSIGWERGQTKVDRKLKRISLTQAGFRYVKAKMPLLEGNVR